MSSFPRTMQRRILRKRADYEGPEQPTIQRDTGYLTLRATRGWIFISTRRLVAQHVMAKMLDHVVMPRARKPAKVWRSPMPVAPATETRQQRRAAARGA